MAKRSRIQSSRLASIGNKTKGTARKLKNSAKYSVRSSSTRRRAPKKK